MSGIGAQLGTLGQSGGLSLSQAGGLVLGTGLSTATPSAVVAPLPGPSTGQASSLPVLQLSQPASSAAPAAAPTLLGTGLKMGPTAQASSTATGFAGLTGLAQTGQAKGLQLGLPGPASQAGGLGQTGGLQLGLTAATKLPAATAALSSGSLGLRVGLTKPGNNLTAASTISSTAVTSTPFRGLGGVDPNALTGKDTGKDG